MADPGVKANAQALLATIPTNQADAIQALSDLYGESYAAGQQAARTTLGLAVDWDTWTPGSAAQAQAGSQLATLLQNAGVEIQGMTDSRLDEMATLLADSLGQGWSVDTLAGNLEDILANPDRAEMIANTETARAVTAAALSEYQTAGVPEVEWLAEDDACPDCLENEDAAPLPLGEDFPNGDVPVHPSCRCAQVPFYPDDQGQSDDTGDEEAE